MATENLTKDGKIIIATDTTKPTNAALKAQGWSSTVEAANEPPSGQPV